MTVQNLNRDRQRFSSVAWGKLIITAIGVALFASGLYFVFFVGESPVRRTDYKTLVIYEPVLEKALSDTQASMDLNIAPIILAIPSTVSAEGPIQLELSMPLLAEVELLPDEQTLLQVMHNGFDPFSVDGSSVQEFFRFNPDISEFEGISLDPSETYTATVRLLPQIKPTRIKVESGSSPEQKLLPQTWASWTWSMRDLHRGLGTERIQFDVGVNDQNKNPAGRAIVTVTLSNSAGIWPFVPVLMLIIGYLLMVIGFANALSRIFKEMATAYSRAEGTQGTSSQSQYKVRRILSGLNRIILPERKLGPPSSGPSTVAGGAFKFLPYTPLFKNWLKYHIKTKSRERMAQFQSLSSLSDDTKLNLLASMRRFSIQLAKIDVNEEIWRAYTFPVFILSAFYLTYIILFITPVHTIMPKSVLQVLRLAHNSLLQANNLYATVAITVVFPIIGIVTLLLYLLPTIFPLFLVDRWHERKRRGDHPDALIVDRLLGVLSSAEKSDIQWMSLGTKKELARKLEEIANVLERFLPRRLHTGNVSTDRSFEQRASEIAAALREIKLWVLTPKADSRSRFLKRIAVILEQALRGEWGEMPHTTPPASLRPSLLIPRILKMASTLIIAVLPLVILVLAIRSGFLQSDADFTQKLSGGALVFAIITVITAIDSSFGDKIDIIQKISGLVVPKSEE